MAVRYREQIRKACVKLDRRGKAFDYVDVMAEIPDALKPTERQVIIEMAKAKYLTVRVDGDKDNRTRYRLKQRFRDDRRKKA